ncbi:roadblock/LC7 domain-containing protein [Streptomyces halstedii]|uniref:roadblock/LC7 domain-containing protein n=1 Tax=Streptomyces halstedii TaxID=1944 RepID=UPI0034610236
MSTPAAADLSWILNELAAFPHARHALLLSADGLRTAASKDVGRDLADKIAASASGLQSLSRQAAALVAQDDTPWQQTMIQYKDGFLFLIAAGRGSYLVASAGPDVDVLVFSDEMARAVRRLGEVMGVAPRSDVVG